MAPFKQFIRVEPVCPGCTGYDLTEQMLWAMVWAFQELARCFPGSAPHTNAPDWIYTDVSMAGRWVD